MKTRKEFDSIGGINVPNDKYWGASTQRSRKFFNIGKILVPFSIIRSIPEPPMLEFMMMYLCLDLP